MNLRPSAGSTTLLLILLACGAPGSGAAAGQEGCSPTTGAVPADRAAPGCLLRNGMRLVYEAEGQGESTWTVERVRRGVELGGRTGCSEIVFAGRGAEGGPEVRWRCREDGFMYGHDAGSSAWVILRPVGSGMSWERRSEDGTLVARYTTEEATFEDIGDLPVGVVPTTVEMFDSTGAVTRRLRERYAPGLETATGGVFEVPDADDTSGWRVVTVFQLVSILPPDPGHGSMSVPGAPRRISFLQRRAGISPTSVMDQPNLDRKDHDRSREEGTDADDGGPAGSRVGDTGRSAGRRDPGSP